LALHAERDEDVRTFICEDTAALNQVLRMLQVGGLSTWHQKGYNYLTPSKADSAFFILCSVILLLSYHVSKFAVLINGRSGSARPLPGD
jgi:hypothetical protein